jgi:hypothetical protein
MNADNCFQSLPGYDDTTAAGRGRKPVVFGCGYCPLRPWPVLTSLL